MDIEIKEVFFEIRRALRNAEDQGVIITNATYEIIDHVELNYELEDVNQL